MEGPDLVARAERLDAAIERLERADAMLSLGVRHIWAAHEGLRNGAAHEGLRNGAAHKGLRFGRDGSQRYARAAEQPIQGCATE
jgi:hypothetical protein